MFSPSSITWTPHSLALVHGEIEGATSRSSSRQHVVGNHGELGEENKGGKEEAAQEHRVVLEDCKGLGLVGGLVAILLLILGNEILPFPLSHSFWAADLWINSLVVLDLRLDHSLMILSPIEISHRENNRARDSDQY